MRLKLVDADMFEVVTTKLPDGMDAESYIAGMDFILNKIDDALTIEPERKWIPCSERLPEEPYGCLVTVHWQDPYSGEYDQIYHETVGYDGEGWNNSEGWTLPYEITAWMPLPEPYKE